MAHNRNQKCTSEWLIRDRKKKDGSNGPKLEAIRSNEGARHWGG